ncbi:MAG: tetratricopeptide repeat protein, partial [Nitrospiraceae bacterium]
EGIILKALEKEPENRYQSAKELAVDLRRLGTPGSAAAVLSARRPATRRRLVWAAGVALVALLAALVGLNVGGLRERLLGGPAVGQITSIAVLPLQNLMGDPEQDYFVAGMHEELIATLAKIGALTVISRTSVMQYKEARKSLPEIARELGVGAIIEGSVRRAGNQVRITVQLIEAATDKNLFAESYQRELRDVLALQSDVAQAIAREVKVTLTPEEETRLARARPVDPEAYELYLKGRFFLDKATAPAAEKSIEFFQQAIERDAEFALAYAGLVGAYAFYGQMASLPQADFVPKMKKAALKALEIDDMMGEAHASLGLIRMDHEWDWEGAEREYKRAIELSPNNAKGYLRYSQLLNLLGRHEEALAKVKRARELDPLNPFIALNVIFRYHYLRNHDQALEESRKLLEMFPDYWVNHWARGMVFSAKGMHEEAVVEAQKAVDLSKGSLETLPPLGHAYARAGRKAEAEKVLARFEAESRQRHIPAYYFVIVYSGLGEKDRAFEWLEKSFQQHELWVPWITVDPMADPLRDDPRFEDLLQRLNLPAN